MKKIPLEPTAGNVLVRIPTEQKQRRGVIINVFDKKTPIAEIMAVGENDSELFPVSKNIKPGKWTITPSIFKNEIIYDGEHYAFVHHLDIRCVIDEKNTELFDVSPL